MSRWKQSVTWITGLALAGCASRPEVDPNAPQKLDAQEAFAHMKTLAGHWKATLVPPPGELAPAGQSSPASTAGQPAQADQTGHSGQPGLVVPIDYEVASGGHSLLEKLYAGQPDEMVTMYYLEGVNLDLAHYCSIGNRPHLRLDRAHSTRDDLHFDFVNGTDIDPKKDHHIHFLRVQWKDADTIVSSWVAWKNGQAEPRTEFVLSRKPDSFTPLQ